MPEDRIQRDDETSTSVDRSEKPDSLETGPRAPNTAINALIGAAITVITAFFIPLSPVLGGATAGYLEGANADNGLKIGAISGLIALLPLLVIVPVLLVVLIFDPIAAVSFVVIIAIIAAFLATYTIGLSALGGVLGVYLYKEFGS